jgi:hypothetical protein
VKFFAIVYDLRQPGRKYDELYAAIKETAGDDKWQHPMESFWVVAFSDYSDWDTESLYNTLRKYIDDNDSLFITRIDSIKHQGWMPKSFWAWFKENREKQ